MPNSIYRLPHKRDIHNPMTVANYKKESDAKLPWDAIAAVLGAVSGLSLFLSIVFDMGYFDTVGLRFADIPTTISDHVRSALLWIPQAVAAAFAYALLTILQWRFGDLMRLRSPNSDENQPPALTSLRLWVNRGVIGAAFLVIWVDLLTGGQFGKYAAVASTVVISYIVFDSVSRSDLAKRHSTAKLLALCSFPVITIFVYNVGVSRAIEERDEPRKATLTFEGPKEVNLTVYRYLDRGVLAGNGQGIVLFYRWEDIKLLTAAFQTPERTNWLCKAIDVTCPKAVKSTATKASGPTP